MGTEDLICNPNFEDDIEQCDVFDKIKFHVLDEKHQSQKGIILNYGCDIAQDKFAFIHACVVLPYEKLFWLSLEKEQNITKEQFKADELSISKIKKIKEKTIQPFIHLQYPRRHWLGKLPNIVGFWYVDFEIITCIRKEDIKKINRIAKVSSPIKESVVSKHGQYLGRISLPFSKDDYNQEIEEVYEHFKGA